MRLTAITLMATSGDPLLLEQVERIAGEDSDPRIRDQVSRIDQQRNDASQRGTAGPRTEQFRQQCSPAHAVCRLHRTRRVRRTMTATSKEPSHGHSDGLASDRSAPFLLFLPRLSVTAIVVAVAWLARRRGPPGHRAAGTAAEHRGQPVAPLRRGRLLRLLAIGGIIALGTLGINVSALVAGLGLTGLAIGLALKEIISNIFAGIMVILYKPFKDNDHIAVTTFEGRVVEINLRFTTLEAGDKRIYVPNAMVISNAVVVDKAAPGAGAGSGVQELRRSLDDKLPSIPAASGWKGQESGARSDCRARRSPRSNFELRGRPDEIPCQEQNATRPLPTPSSFPNAIA